MSKLVLAFGRDTHVNQGLNVTVRSGDKWSQTRAGEELCLVSSGPGTFQERIIGDAVVVGVEIVHGWDDFLEDEDLKNAVLRFEHSHRARTLEGLEDAMQVAYGDGWKNQTIVVIFFYV